MNTPVAITGGFSTPEFRECIVEIPYVSAREIYLSCRRLLDILASLALLIALAPILLAIALLVKLDSPGPVLFVQERVGIKRRHKGGTVRCELATFRFYKFRSMVRNADASLHQQYIRNFVQGCAGENGNGTAPFKLTRDPRVTRLGRLLRRTSLDELPQLVNVLLGDMSLVGPRPVPSYEAALYDPQQLRRLAVQPGITGLWQVCGRCQVPFEHMIRLDLDYVERCSLWLDCKILLLTLPAVLSGRGAE